MKVLDSTPFITASARMTQILVVEDEYIIASNLQENLKSLGYDVVDIASSGAEGIAKATALRPDLVLMDIRLQGDVDGIQAAEQIWGALQIPVIYVTGHSDQSTLERAQMTVPFGYLLKPVKSKELYVAIETALKRYEREQLFSTVLRSIGDGMIVTNTQGQIMFLNVAAEQLTGWQQAEARDRDLREVFNVIHEDTRCAIDNVAVIAVEQDTTIFLNERMLLITKDGSTLPLADSIAPIKNHAGIITGTVLIFRDDTQRRRQQEQTRALERAQLLEQQNEELQRLDQLKDDFLSMVSHELRSPLANIKMAIRMLEVTLEQQALETEATSGSSLLSHYIGILRDQCNRELNLVNDLLELQQLEAGARPIEWVSIQLNDCLAQSTLPFQERVRSRSQHLQVLVSPDLPVLVSDLEILTRILRELLTNACKYTPPGGTITISVEAEPQVEGHPFSKPPQRDQSAQPQVIQIRVCNSGDEIPADELTRIFDKFYRIPTRDRWQQGGTGLGLGLVKQSVVYLGGSIWAESNAIETRFIIELPIVPLETCTNSL